MTRLIERRIFRFALAISLMIFFAPAPSISQVGTGAVRKVKSDAGGYYRAAGLLIVKEFHLSVAANSGPQSLTLNAAGLSALAGAVRCSKNSINKGGMA